MKTKRLFAALFVLFAMSANLWAVEVTIDGIKYDVIKKGKTAKVLSNSPRYSGNIVIPETVEYEGVECKVTAINNSAFYSCSELISVSIPDNVTDLGESTFEGCKKLVEVHLGTGITAIRSEDFYNCTALKTINIPSTVTEIGNKAFDNCSALTSISLPDGLESIGTYAFYGTGLTKIIMGDGLKTIGSSAFSYCSSLTQAVIGSNVTTIGGSAFKKCPLTSVKIPNSVTSLGGSAFEDCNKLLSVQIGSGVSIIPSFTFQNCTELMSVYIIGNTLTELQWYCFCKCKNLIVIKLPSSVTTIGGHVFEECSLLYNVEMKEGLQLIDSYAFSKCTDLHEISIPNSVTHLEDYAFSQCTNLAKVWIGTGIKKIDDYAFYKDENLEDFYCYAVEPPTATSYTFQYAYPEYATLHVPAESVNTYKTTSPWSSFGTIVATDGSTPLPPVPEKCATPTINVNGDRVSFSCATEGASFVYDVKPTCQQNGVGGDLRLISAFTVSVYATKSGYDNSNVATKDIVVNTKKGDVNDDGKVTITDAVSVVNIILSGETSAPKMDVPQEPELMVEPE